MKWVLVIASQALRAKRDIPAADIEQIDKAYSAMRDDPYSGDITFLMGTDHVLRRRVGV